MDLAGAVVDSKYLVEIFLTGGHIHPHGLAFTVDGQRIHSAESQHQSVRIKLSIVKINETADALNGLSSEGLHVTAPGSNQNLQGFSVALGPKLLELGKCCADAGQLFDRIRKNQASPRQMMKIVLYAAMNRIYSSRDIQRSCQRDINFMYLLEGMPVPDHATIARFVSLHFSRCSKELMTQMSEILYALGETSGKTIFIDGTKIESVSNKYGQRPIPQR